MADEPVLCFDGDGAGLRAAFRAVELAMPRLKPGKSLKFALLPQGQDPDDLLRSGGREAIADVIGAARPLAAMLWARETEGHSFDTPERRAALEARLNEVTAAIGDDCVRKYYRQDFNARLSQFFAPAQGARGDFRRGAGPGQEWRERGPWQGRNGAPQRPATGGKHTPYVVVSQQLAASPLHRGYRTSVPHARGADPAGRAQLPLAAARPPGGTGLARVPPCRRREAERRPDRHRRPCRGAPMPRRSGGTVLAAA